MSHNTDILTYDEGGQISYGVSLRDKFALIYFEQVLKALYSEPQLCMEDENPFEQAMIRLPKDLWVMSDLIMEARKEKCNESKV